MRGTVAKRLRAEARENSKPSQMTLIKAPIRRMFKGTLIIVGYRPILKQAGYRRAYQDAKKRYLQGGIE